MTLFERMKKFYQWGWATKEQLARYVQFNRLTAQEYEEIVGEAISQ